MEENDHFVDAINEMINNKEFKSAHEITELDFIDALFINNVLLTLNEESSITIDLEEQPDYLLGHLALY